MEVIKFDETEFKEKVIPKYFTSGEQADLYLYIDDNKEMVLKIYREELLKEKIRKIKDSNLKVDEHMMIRPEKLISINNTIVGYSSKFQFDYTSISNLKLDNLEKLNILMRVKDIFIKLLYQGIYFYDINGQNIMYNGKNILLCDVPDAYLFSKDNDSSLNSLAYRSFNIFTISYLNNISIDMVEKETKELLYKWSNLKDYDDLVGVTDNNMCINICYDLFYGKNDNNELLINYLDKEKMKKKMI